MTETPWNAPDAPAPWSAPDKPLAALVDSYAEDRADVPRNHHGQYLIPSADGRQPAPTKGRPRVSTIAKVGPNTDLLQKRAERLIVAGLAADPSINADAMKAQALDPDSKQYKNALQSVAARAFQAAGGNDRANRGTLIHSLVERVNRGELQYPEDIPEALRPDVKAYYEVLRKHDLEVLPEYMERVVLCPYDTAGAVDNIMRRWNPDTESYELVVVDLKTGRSLDFSRLPIMSQLWMYANATCFFVTTDIERDKDGKITQVRGFQEDMPLDLRRDKAVIIHLDGQGAAFYYEVDISGHGRVVDAQIEIKRADAEAQYKFRLVGSVTPDAFVAPHTSTSTDVQSSVTPAAQPLGPTLNAIMNNIPDPVTTGYTDMIDRTFGDRATETMRAQAAAADAVSVTHSGPVTVATDSLIENTAQLGGDGKPLGPLADRAAGERGCSVCHRKGHKSTSKVKGTDRLVCLGDQDPAKRLAATPALGTEPIQPHEDDGPNPTEMVARIDAQARAQGRNDDPDDGVPLPETTAYPVGSADVEPAGPFAPAREPEIAVPGGTVPESIARSHYPEALPYCDGSHPGPCGWHADPQTGDYVCATSGKPSRMVWESRQGDRTLAAISQETDPAILLGFRQAESLAGRWTPEHESACFAYYQKLTGQR